MQALWVLPLGGYSWATGGYMGAVSSGQTTCGLLIGSNIAIGLRCGQGKKDIPEVYESERNKAINSVGELYRDFLREFSSTDCKTVCHCDFSDPEDFNRYVTNKGWRNTCGVILKFVMNKRVKMAGEGKI